MTWFQNHIRQDAGRFSDFWAPMSNFRTSHFLRSRENPDIYCGKLLSWLTMIQCLHASDGQSHIESCTQILKFLAKRFKPISQILKFKSRNYCKSQIFSIFHQLQPISVNDLVSTVKFPHKQENKKITLICLSYTLLLQFRADFRLNGKKSHRMLFP